MLSLEIDYRKMVNRMRELDRILDGFVLGSTDYMELVTEAFSDNIHWTTKIEGNKMSLDDVERLTSRFTNGEYIESNNGPTQEILKLAPRATEIANDPSMADSVPLLLEPTSTTLAPITG